MRKISVIVPVYNVEVYLEKCILSLINQTYKNIEIILVDDGSTDKSGKICDLLKARDTRVNVYHKKNGGLSSARNYGIRKAKGKLISFVDSDDVLNEHMLEILEKNMTKENSDISICNYVKFYENESPKYETEGEVKIYNRDEALSKLLTNDIENFAWNKLYKIELFKDVEFPEGMNYEDIATTYKVFEKSERIVVTNCKLYGYLMRGTSITGKLSKKSFLDCITATKNRYVHFTNNQILQKDISYNYVLSYYNFYKTFIKYFKKDEEIKKIIDDMYSEFKECYKKTINERKKYYNSKIDYIFVNLLYFNKYIFSIVCNIMMVIK